MQKNTEYAMFFDSNEDNDRLYSSADLRDFFSKFLSNGVVGTESTANLQVCADVGMNIKVNEGTCIVNGAIRNFDGTVLSVNYGDNTYNRIDSIILRYDETARNIDLKIVEGTPSENPEPPAIVRNETVYDIVLAHVEIKRGCVVLTQEDITDMRFDKNVCGIVTGLIKQIDTTTLFAQYQSAWNAFVEQLGASDKVTINTEDVQGRKLTDSVRMQQSFGSMFTMI